MLALVVDDHPLTRQGLVDLANNHEKIHSVDQAGEFSAAWDTVSNEPPGVAIMDLRLGDRDSLELITHIRRENADARILVVSMYPENVFAQRVIKAGANGFISKLCSPQEIGAALERVISGRTYLSDDVLEAAINPRNIGKAGAIGDIDSLTNRELEVLRLIGQGISSRRIAEKLSIAPRTVDSHKEHIKQKLKAADAAELAKRAAVWLDTEQIA